MELCNLPVSDEDAEAVFQLVQKTIAAVYPNYYPRDVVDFFLQLHSRENIQADVEKGVVIALQEQGRLVGTGSCEGNHITRVYVSSDCQGRGYGSLIMDCLEKSIAAQHQKICLDASLPACAFYERRGYRTAGHGRVTLESGVVLVYEQMEKDC